MIGAGGGYAGQLVNWVWTLRRWHKIRLEIVPRLGGSRFTGLPKHWIGERRWAWLRKWRRFRCADERHPVHSETFIYIAMIGLMTRRLARTK